MASATSPPPRLRVSPRCEGEIRGHRGRLGLGKRGAPCVRPAGRPSSSKSAPSSSAADVSHPMTRADIDDLVATTSLDELCAMARSVRASGPNPHTVTFSPKVFIPLTRACRDHCGYCTFARDPTKNVDENDDSDDSDNASRREKSSPPPQSIYMSADEVVAVAEQGRAAGCTECLFTLGDRPEAKYEEAKEELKKLGFASTVEYLTHCCEQVLEHTGLLPHVNAGVLAKHELKQLRHVSVSQGLMLESAAERLVVEPGAAHYGCDTKRPGVRLKVMQHAGELRIPFTSGILVGIGETREERLDALFDLKKIHDDGGGHLQEILIQSFRAKLDTAMRNHPEPTLDDLVWTCAVARLVFGPDVAIQSPPNLTPEPDDAVRDEGIGDASSSNHKQSDDDPSSQRALGWRALLNAGISCWGGVSPGVTPDFVSPEMSWPTLSELAAVTIGEGFVLTPRLAVQPRFILGKKNYETWIDPAIAPFCRVLSDAEGFSRSSGWCPGRDEVGDNSESPLDTENHKKNRLPSWRRMRNPKPTDLVTVNGTTSGGLGLGLGLGLGFGDVSTSSSQPSALDSAIDRLDERGRFLKDLAERGDDLLLEKLSDSLYANGTYCERGGLCVDVGDDTIGDDNVGAISHTTYDASQQRAHDVHAVMQILSSRGSEFDKTCAVADEKRKKQSGSTVTWCTNRNINYTNVCTLSCIFCAFSKGKKTDKEGEELRGAAYLLSLDEVSERVKEAWTRGATEVCMQGGIHPEFDGTTYLDLLKAAKKGAPLMHIHAFSPLEVAHGAETYKGGVDVSEYLQLLKDAGLGSLPGTAAEILSDDVRSELCPDKLTSEQWLSVVSAAHDVNIPTTSTIMFGHVDDDTVETRAAHLLAIRDAHLKSVYRKAKRELTDEDMTPRASSTYNYTGGFTEFVPLPFVHFEAPAFRNGVTRKGPTLRESILLHAAARLTLGAAGLTNIQASWVKMGPEFCGVLLNAGCNDVGGTLMNESITRAAGAKFGQEMGPRELRRIIENEKGRTPKMRTTLYKPAGTERERTAVTAAPLREV